MKTLVQKKRNYTDYYSFSIQDEIIGFTEE